MGFFWPLKLKAEPSALGRFGRVLHWLGIAIAVAWLWVGVTTESEGDLSFAASMGAGFYMTGRALRYILSGE